MSSSDKAAAIYTTGDNPMMSNHYTNARREAVRKAANAAQVRAEIAEMMAAREAGYRARMAAMQERQSINDRMNEIGDELDQAAGNRDWPLCAYLQDELNRLDERLQELNRR